MGRKMETAEKERIKKRETKLQFVIVAAVILITIGLGYTLYVTTLTDFTGQTTKILKPEPDEKYLTNGTSGKNETKSVDSITTAVN